MGEEIKLNIEGVNNKIEELKVQLLQVHKKIRVYENKAQILEANLRSYSRKLSQLMRGDV